MYPSVVSVKPLSDYKLLLVFEPREKRIFDVTPYLNTERPAGVPAKDGETVHNAFFDRSYKES